LPPAIWTLPSGRTRSVGRQRATCREPIEAKLWLDREAAGDQDLAALEEDGPVGLTRNAKSPGEQGKAPRGRVVDLRGPLGVAARDQDAAVGERRGGVAGTRPVH